VVKQTNRLRRKRSPLLQTPLIAAVAWFRRI
jgi:hypothetical protein